MPQKSDRDQVRAAISTGGWEIAWGDMITEFQITTGVFATVLGGPAGASAWVSSMIAAQQAKFQKSVGDISPAVREQAIAKAQEILKHGLNGEWKIGGLGIKGGIATYHRLFKAFVGGWNKLPPNHVQPYIGIRIIPNADGDSDDTTVVEIPDSSANDGVTESPDSPPPSPIGT